jgi:adenylate cyclase
LPGKVLIQNTMGERKLNFWGPSKRRRYIWGLTVALLAGGIFCLLFGLNVFSSFQLQSNDFFFRSVNYNATLESDSKEIVIIGIDDKSLDQLGRFSSWPRSYYAQLVNVLDECKSRVVVFDLLFSDPESDDQLLASSIKSAKNVILAEVKTEFPKSLTIAGQTGRNDNLLCPNETLLDSGVSVGHANVSADKDGIVRRLPILINTDAGFEPALSITAVSKYLRRPEVIESSIQNNHLLFAGRLIPLDEDGEMTVNYSASGRFRELSFVDVLRGNVDPDLLKDKIVLVGATAIGLMDYFWTPMGYRLNGVEIHGHAINTILSDNFLDPISTGITMACIIVLALLCGFIVLRFRVVYAVAGAFILCAVYLFLVFLNFDRGIMMSAAYPPMAVLGSFGSVSLYKLANEQSQKNMISRVFGRYVSAPVATRVLQDLESGHLDLGGKEQEITVLFADARGFTSLSEDVKPNDLVRTLNFYLSAIIQAVLKYDGMINKFGGDSIMAVWNTPTPRRDHAFLAIKAALEAQQAIKNLRESDEKILIMDFGIGINTGMVVAGNMGSQDRIEYSVIGDTVNTASRITGLTPKGKIWIGENTLKSAGERVIVDQLDPLEMKGKKQPVAVYEVKNIL